MKEMIAIKNWSKFKKIMIISGLISTILTIILFTIYKFIKIDIFETLSITFFVIAFHLDMRLIIGKIVSLFKNKINIDSNYFKLKKFEQYLYKKLNVKRWKSKVPTYDPNEFELKNHELNEILRNMCNSEIVHTLNVIISYIPIFFIICFGVPIVFIITSVLASIFDLQFVMIQRYNRPRIIKIMEKK